MAVQADFKILNIPDDTKYWFVRANSEGEYYQDYYLNNFIATDSNGINIEDIIDVLAFNKVTDTLAIKAQFKQYFNNHDLKILNAKLSRSKLSKDEKDSLRTRELKRSTSRSRRVGKFVDELKIGDFVFVPAKSSKKFLVGIIISDCLDNNVQHIKQANLNYSICNFSLIRKVKWIKELTFEQMPDSLSWIKSAHQSIFDISSYDNLLNSCISSLYQYKKQIFYRLNVKTTYQLSANDWLAYQLLIQDIVVNSLDDIYQKIKVQSPGHISLSALKNKWPYLLLIPVFLFGKSTVNVGNVTTEIQNPLEYFTSEGKRSRQLDNDLKQANVYAQKAKADKAEAEAKKIEAETQSISQASKSDSQKEKTDRLKAKAQYYKGREQENSKLIKRQFGSKSQTDEINNSKPHVDTKQRKKVLNRFDIDDKSIGTEINKN